MISLLIVDRSQFMADTMWEILGAETDIEIVDITIDADSALRQVNRCNALIVSAALPGDVALKLVRAAVASNPKVKVVVMDLVKPGTAAREYMAAGAAACCYEEETIGALLQKARAEVKNLPFAQMLALPATGDS